MELTPRENDKLSSFTAALLAESHKARGRRFNDPKAVVYLSIAIAGARDGRSVAERMSYSTLLLTRDEVMNSIAELVSDIQVETIFPGGAKFVTVQQPIV
ncbi:urease subunit gamma [Chitinivorax sp. PXF-14]|uniref:urease subunit gamma n=1 Tax=Chitinivorax sp. PXF-14 TaxID=3230488 RepID=UPI0034672291